MNELGLTQEKTAALLDCSVGQVNMLLSGERKFHSEWIDRISKAFKVPAWYLFVDPKSVLDEFDRELSSRFRAAPDDVQTNIKRQLGMLEMPSFPTQPSPAAPATFHDNKSGVKTNFDESPIIKKGKKK